MNIQYCANKHIEKLVIAVVESPRGIILMSTKMREKKSAQQRSKAIVGAIVYISLEDGQISAVCRASLQVEFRLPWKFIYI
jgi:hypothetical protein